MRDRAADNPLRLNLGLIVALSLAGTGIATGAAGGGPEQPQSTSESQCPERILELPRPGEVFWPDNVSPILYASEEAPASEPMSVSDPDNVSWPGKMSQISYTSAKASVSGLSSVSDCELFCNGCRRCSPTWHFVVGVEATFLARISDGSSVRVDITDTGIPSTNSYFGEDSSTSLTGGPRVWVGMQGKRWGLQFRNWELDDTKTTVAPLQVGGTTSSTALDALDAHTIDLELTHRSCCRKTEMVASFGARHARLGSHTSISVTEIVGANLHNATAWSNRDMDATGITFALSGLRPIGRSSWHSFCTVRGSLLWGDANVGVQTSSAGVGPGVSASRVDFAVANSNESLFIGEIQIGVHRYFKLERLPASAFFRAALEYQYWDAGGGNFATTFSSVGIPGSTSVATATAGALRTDLIGFAVGTGFYW